MGRKFGQVEMGLLLKCSPDWSPGVSRGWGPSGAENPLVSSSGCWQTSFPCGYRTQDAESSKPGVDGASISLAVGLT